MTESEKVAYEMGYKAGRIEILQGLSEGLFSVCISDTEAERALKRMTAALEAVEW